MNHYETLKEKLITVPELANILKVSEMAIYSRIKRGTIPGIMHLGSSVRFDGSIISEWLNAKVNKQQTRRILREDKQ